MVDTNGTANSSIETENKEELLIFPANTVTKKETMMVKNIDASPKKPIWHEESDLNQNLQ